MTLRTPGDAAAGNLPRGFCSTQKTPKVHFSSPSRLYQPQAVSKRLESGAAVYRQKSAEASEAGTIFVRTLEAMEIYGLFWVEWAIKATNQRDRKSTMWPAFSCCGDIVT
jgi:hypothetical protein